MQIEIFLEKMQVVCISINTSYVSIFSLHKTWDSLYWGILFPISGIIIVRYTLMPMFLQPLKRLVYGHPIDSRRSLVCFHSLKSSVKVILIQYLFQEIRLCTVPFLPYPVE